MTKPKRKPTRLKDYDYSTPGAYFITICTKERKELLGKIENGLMKLNGIGCIVNQEILNVESHYQNIKIDKYVIMPNHVHMIITILDSNSAERINPFPTTIKYDIPNVVGKFKAAVTRNAKQNNLVGNAFMHSATGGIWQHSYHDHAIRGKKDYQKIWEYIDTNVIKWEMDCFYNYKTEQ